MAEETTDAGSQGADRDITEVNADLDVGFEEAAAEAKGGAPAKHDDGMTHIITDEPADKPTKEKPSDEKPRDDKGQFVKADGEDKAKKETPAPVVKKKDAATPDPAEPKTAMEKAEAEVAAIEAKEAEAAAAAAGKPKETPAEEQKDILDLVPPQYEWAKAERDSGRLAEFLAKQPKAIQKIANSGDVEDAIYFLDLYKKSLETPVGPTTKAETKAFLEEYGEMKVKDGEGNETTLKDLVGGYNNAELIEALGTVFRAMTRSGGAPGFDPRVATLERELSDIKTQRATEAAERASEKYWSEIERTHSDARQVYESDTFKTWINGDAPASVKKLYNMPGTDRAIRVFDCYKEAMALKAGKEVTTDGKNVADNLHSHTLGTTRKNGTGVPTDKDGGDPKDAEAEILAGFEEAERESKGKR